jgi:hypothetical protein
VDYGARYGGEDEGKEAVAEDADALEERHAAAQQLGVHGYNRGAAPRHDEHGAEHEAAVVRGGELGVELGGGGALAGQEDGQGEAEDERAPQVPVLQLCARLQLHVSAQAVYAGKGWRLTWMSGLTTRRILLHTMQTALVAHTHRPQSEGKAARALTCAGRAGWFLALVR